jgi:hypothetical protein
MGLFFYFVLPTLVVLARSGRVRLRPRRIWHFMLLVAVIALLLAAARGLG